MSDADRHLAEAWGHALASTARGWVAAFVRAIHTLEPEATA